MTPQVITRTAVTIQVVSYVAFAFTFVYYSVYIDFIFIQLTAA